MFQCLKAYSSADSLDSICGSAGSEERRRTEALVQQALEAVSRVSKGFSLQLCTQTRPAIGDLLAGPLRAAIHIPQARRSRHFPRSGNQPDHCLSFFKTLRPLKNFEA